MSNFQTFAIITEGNTSTAPSRFVASTSDSLGTITATGYMNDLAGLGQVKPNDIIDINYSDTSTFPLSTGESATLGTFVVTYSAPNWSLSNVTSFLQVTSTAISAANFLGMYATPILLVAAPGANKLIVVDRMELVLTYGTTQFAAGGVVAAQYDSTANGAGVAASSTQAAAGFTGAAASTTLLFNGATSVAAFSTTVNKGIYLSNITAAYTTGDSTLVAQVHYHVIATA